MAITEKSSPAAEKSAKRIQKFLSECEICSRRAAERAIELGEVSINGKRAELGQKVRPEEDRICFRGQVVRPKKRRSVLILMNKPVGYICSNSDPNCELNVFQLLPLYSGRKLFCCGRLDKDSEGLLLLSSNGDLAQKICHPSQRIEKFYRLWLDRNFDWSKRKLLLKGVEDGGERLAVHRIFPAASRGSVLELSLMEGKKRHLRRLLAGLGYEVRRLLRYRIGDFTLGNLKPGKYRELSEERQRQLLKAGRGVSNDGEPDRPSVAPPSNEV